MLHRKTIVSEELRSAPMEELERLQASALTLGRGQSAKVISRALGTFHISRRVNGEILLGKREVEKWTPPPTAGKWTKPETDPKKWGPPIWEIAHKGAATLETPEARKKLVRRVRSMVPCGDCKTHWDAMVEAFPPDYSSREAFSRWMWERHNQVSRRTGRTAEISLEEARALYPTLQLP